MSTPKSESINKLSDQSDQILTKEQYINAFKQFDAEARYTFIAAALVTVVFWLAIFLTHDMSVNVFYLPLWFVLSCLGGYIFSVVVVVLLVKFFLKPLPLKVESLKDGNAFLPNENKQSVNDKQDVGGL